MQKMQGIRLKPSGFSTELSTYIFEDGIPKPAFGKIPINYEQLVAAAQIKNINSEDFCIDPTGVKVEILRETGSSFQVEFIFPEVLQFLPGVELNLTQVQGQKIGQFVVEGETKLTMRIGHHVLPIVKATRAATDMWETFSFPGKQEDIVDDEGLKALFTSLAKSHKSEARFFPAREQFLNTELQKLITHLNQ